MTATSIISAILIGIVVGVLGRLVLPGRQRIGILLTVLIGVGAALLGTVIARQFAVADTGGVDWVELAIQVGLAAVGVGLASLMLGRRSTVG
ncbi:MAG: GlsB/YeaQ/YmgE family stress response membrane protein [Micromonosporaceae bacterium]